MIDVTVCIPSIPPRAPFLARALASVAAQTVAERIIVSYHIDHEGVGAALSRNAAAASASTEWLAFLDDDDEFLPQHIEVLLRHAEETGADYVFSTFEVPEVPNFRLDSFCYDEFDPSNPLQTTITTLIRRSVFERLGGYSDPTYMTKIHGDTVGEDFDFTKRCIAAGVRISHAQEVTWLWHHHGANTSGRKWNR